MNTKIKYNDCKLYFPSLDKTGNPLNPEIENNVFSLVRDSICQELGGLTVYTVKGYYKNSLDQIISENILLIQAYSDNIEKAYTTLKKLSEIIKNELNQESVLFEINNNPEFI